MAGSGRKQPVRFSHLNPRTEPLFSQVANVRNRSLRKPSDKAFLHRIAGEFDRLAEMTRCEDPSYYAARAAQEVSAAVKVQHSRARLAHLIMAQHYAPFVRGTRQHWAEKSGYTC